MTKLDPATPGTTRRLWIALIVACVVVAAAALVYLSTGRLTADPEAGAKATPTTSLSQPPGGQSTDPPDKAQLAALLGMRVLFGHQSIGMSILEAMPPVFEKAGLSAPKIINSELPAVRDTTTDPVFAHSWIGANGDPMGKIRAFADIFNKPVGQTFDIAFMKLGAIDFTSDTDVQAVFNAYTSTMAQLEKDHPKTVFLYSTITLTTEGEDWTAVGESELGTPTGKGTDNALREQYNAMIRERFASTGRLFDIADMEARVGADQVSARMQGGVYYRVMNPALSSDGLHLNAKGANSVATGLLRLLGPIAEQVKAGR